jgi:hypothetical protein
MRQLRIIYLFGWVICLLACSEQKKSVNLIFKGPKSFSIKTRTDIIHGVGLDAAQDFSTYSLRHVTNSILTVDELPTN